MRAHTDGIARADRIVMELDHLGAVASMVRAGLGLAIVRAGQSPTTSPLAGWPPWLSG